MPRMALLARRYAFEVLVLLGSVEGVAEVIFRGDALRGPRTGPWLAGAAVALSVLPLLGRRRYPFGAPAVVWLLASAFSFVDGQLIASSSVIYVAGIAAAFLLGSSRTMVEARTGVAVVVLGAAIVAYHGPDFTPVDLVFVPALFTIAWLAGYALRSRAAQAEAAEERARHAEQEREAAARVAVAEERARIARELHDIVAHAVSVMVLQVGAVRHQLPRDAADHKEALVAVEQAGRAALVEMRRLLGAMHDDREAELAPQPGLDDLDALVDRVRRAGLPVRVHVQGAPVPLPRAVELSAYRIVQEGLTNSLKHAHARHADVTVRYGPQDLSLEVRDDGSGAPTGDGLGRGLVGVRERVKIYGGEMAAGAAPGGGYLLTARLLLDGNRR